MAPSIDYKADLISGALSQVRTLEGTATPATTGIVSQAIGYVVTDPALQKDLTDAAIKTINQALAGGLSKDTAIETAVGLIDSYLQRYAAAHSSP